MFGTTFFGRSYFGNTFFGGGTGIVPPVADSSLMLWTLDSMPMAWTVI